MTAARLIVQESTGETLAGEEEPEPVKDPMAVELGQRGGPKDGKARVRKVTKEQRVAQARKAAAARWGKTEKPTRS